MLGALALVQQRTQMQARPATALLREALELAQRSRPAEHAAVPCAAAGIVVNTTMGVVRVKWRVWVPAAQAWK